MFRRQKGEDHHIANPRVQGYLTTDHLANRHWRGTKADIYEGGHRIPFLVRWPKYAKAGHNAERTITHTDIFATCAELLKAETPKKAEDSHSFLAALSGKKGQTRPGIINHSASGVFAIREGDWKLILSAGSGGRQQPRSKPFEKPYQLYNLANDPSEKVNLINEETEIAKRLEVSFEEIARDHKTSK